MAKHLFVDLSHWQGDSGLTNTAWAALAKCGVKAAIIKATQGTAHVDVAFATNLRRARRHGMLVGAYHFSDGQRGKAQAQHFLRTVRKANGGNLKDVLLVMDVERNPGNGGNPTKYTVKGFAREVQRQAKRNTFLCYTASGYWRSIGNPQLSHLFDGLWQARWDGKRHTCKNPNLPSKPPRAGFGGWTTARFWQFGTQRYGSKRIDGNAFYGTMAKMRDLFTTSKPDKPKPVPPPPPDPATWRDEYNGLIEDAEAAVSVLTPEGEGAVEAKADILAILEAMDIEGET
jgi:lysozyme